LLTGGAGSGAVTAVIDQIGGLGSGLLAEMVIRVWDRLRARGEDAADESRLRDELAEELESALSADSETAAVLRAEIAGVLRGAEAIQVALTAAVEESAAGVQAVLVQGLLELGEEFVEFRGLLQDVSGQLGVLVGDVRQTMAGQQQMLVQIFLLRNEIRGALECRQPIAGGRGPDGLLAGDEHAAVLAATVRAGADSPYPGLAAFQPGDADQFFGRAELTARLAELLNRPGMLMVLGPSGSGKSAFTWRLGGGFQPGWPPSGRRHR
jgi:hypothetical protein